LKPFTTTLQAFERLNPHINLFQLQVFHVESEEFENYVHFQACLDEKISSILIEVYLRGVQTDSEFNQILHSPTPEICWVSNQSQ
jgi:hypothetical protein